MKTRITIFCESCFQNQSNNQHTPPPISVQIQLVNGGSEVEVSPSNVYEYVRRYARHRMVTVAKQPLDNLREGVFDVIPRSALDGLFAEDLRLLLNGVGEIDVQVRGFFLRD